MVSRTSYSKSTTYPEEGGIYGRITQPGVKRPRVNQDQDNATRIKSRVQNERISLLLILVDPESTVCP